MDFAKYISCGMAAKYEPKKMRSRIADVIRKRGLSLRGVSLGAGLSESYLAGVINSGRDPQLHKLIKVCDFLDISVTWALYGFEVPDGADEILQLIAQNPEVATSIAQLLRAQLEDAE